MPPAGRLRLRATTDHTGKVPESSPLSRMWRPGRPVALHATLATLRRGASDPAYRRESDESVWRALRTPLGPATLHLVCRAADGHVLARAWGQGAPAALESVPAMLGAYDDPAGFLPRLAVLRDVVARYPGWRVPRTGSVFQVLVPTVLEQKVTGLDARRAWRWLVARYGTPAPGPAPAGMRVPPDAATWARVPSWDWHRAGVGPMRSRTVLAAARVAGRLEECAAMPPAAAAARLTAVPGIGPWSAAEIGQRALGDADAVSFGDFHMSRDVGWALVGEPLDDDALREVLEPWRGHRYRVVRYVELAGIRRPRRAPRMAPRDFRAM
jgi:3-methyladenine DNA glycosylase/8-oxoguanine DNA glycosylase